MRRRCTARNVATRGDLQGQCAWRRAQSIQGDNMKSHRFLRFTAAAAGVALVTFGVTITDARADERDTLYVSDSGANTVQAFDAATGFSKGTLVPAVGQPNPFQSPLGLV